MSDDTTSQPNALGSAEHTRPTWRTLPAEIKLRILQYVFGVGTTGRRGGAHNTRIKRPWLDIYVQLPTPEPDFRKMSFRVDRLFWTLFVSREFLDTGLPLYVDSASIEFAHTTNITYRPFETELECPDSIVGRVLRYALERVKCIAIEERDVDKLKAHSVDALYEVAKNIVRFDIFTSRMVCWHERDSSVGMGYFYELDDDQLDVHKDEGVPRKVITPAQLAALMETKSFLKDNMTWNMRVRCLASSSITFGNRAGIWAREHHWAVSVRCLLAGDSGNRELTMDLNIDLRTRDTISISTSIGQLEKR